MKASGVLAVIVATLPGAALAADEGVDAVRGAGAPASAASLGAPAEAWMDEPGALAGVWVDDRDAREAPFSVGSDQQSTDLLWLQPDGRYTWSRAGWSLSFGVWELDAEVLRLGEEVRVRGTGGGEQDGQILGTLCVASASKRSDAFAIAPCENPDSAPEACIQVGGTRFYRSTWTPSAQELAFFRRGCLGEAGHAPATGSESDSGFTLHELVRRAGRACAGAGEDAWACACEQLCGERIEAEDVTAFEWPMPGTHSGSTESGLVPLGPTFRLEIEGGRVRACGVERPPPPCEVR